MAANSQQPIIPPAWTVPRWYIDPALSTCAGDNLSGTSATCSGGCVGATCPSGIGPLATYQELNAHRWGCQGNPIACPRLQQNTVVAWISSRTTVGDPVVFRPQTENGAYAELTTIPNVVCSGTLSGFVTRSRTTSPHLYQATLPCAASAGDLIVDSTVGATFWTYTNVSGNTWTFTQPLTSMTVPATTETPAEVVIAGGDSVTVYKLQSVDLVDPRGSMAHTDAAGNQVSVYIYHVGAIDPTNALSSSNLNAFDNPIESSYGPTNPRVAGWDMSANPWNGTVAVNNFFSYMLGGLNPNVLVLGGAILQATILLGEYLDADVILGGITEFAPARECYYGSIYAASNLYFACTEVVPQNYPYGNPVIWGTGAVHAVGTTHFGYAPAVGAVATFTTTGGLAFQYGQPTRGCVGVVTDAGAYGPCNLPLTPSVLDANLTVSSFGCFGLPNGPAFCNY